jgi:FSR family fosmidomycin resistance protein-like MFS transporter
MIRSMKHVAQVSTARSSLGSLAVSHGGVDVYQGAIAALVPVFVHEQAYSLSAAAMIVLATSLTSSVIQPLFGYLGDRRPMRWLVPASIIVSGIGLSLIAFSPSYWVTVALAAVTGIGVAAYHPSAARLARDISQGDHVLMSWFALGGNIGFALAPLIVAVTVGILGLSASPLLFIPALVAFIAAILSMRARTSVQRAAPKAARVVTRQLEDWRSFRWLTAAVMCRSIVFVGLSSFIAIFVEEVRGLGTTSGTVALTLLYIGGAVGTIIGGRLAQRWSRPTILRWSYATVIPVLAGVLFIPGPAVYLFILLASMCLYIPFSLHLTLAQDYLPQHIGTASGVTLGLTVSFGGLVAPAIGALADRTSLLIALTPLLGVAALGLLFLTRLVNPAPAQIETNVVQESNLSPTPS